MAFFVVICVLLRGSCPSGGIGGKVGYRYCMCVGNMVVCYVRVFALCPLPLSNRYTTSSISLHTNVHGRTIKQASTATSGHHSAKQNELFLWKSVSSSRCRSSLNGTSVELRM